MEHFIHENWTFLSERNVIISFCPYFVWSSQTVIQDQFCHCQMKHNSFLWTEPVFSGWATKLTRISVTAIRYKAIISWNIFLDYVTLHISLQGMCLWFQETLLERFRSNLVIQGLKPFEENEWTHFQIGKVKFQVSWTCFLSSFCTLKWA
jgi:hypothetical protein